MKLTFVALSLFAIAGGIIATPAKSAKNITALDGPAPPGCYWDGTAPFCAGSCPNGYTQELTGACGDGACCITRIKALFCRNREPNRFPCPIIPGFTSSSAAPTIIPRPRHLLRLFPSQTLPPPITPETTTSIVPDTTTFVPPADTTPASTAPDTASLTPSDTGVVTPTVGA